MIRKWFTPSSQGSTRLRVLLSLIIVVRLGFALKVYPDPGQNWVINYAAGILYELLWCLALFLFRPRREDAGRIALIVLTATCLLEVLQLWHPGPLEQIRLT